MNIFKIQEKINLLAFKMRYEESAEIRARLNDEIDCLNTMLSCKLYSATFKFKQIRRALQNE